MSRRKLQKFSENIARANLIQPGKELFTKVKGNWNTLFFKNNNPIVLELGCGRGEYTVGMALSDPESNFIGVDIKGDRIWKGSKTADHEKLANVGFLRTQIQSLEKTIAEGVVTGQVVHALLAEQQQPVQAALRHAAWRLSPSSDSEK